MASPLPDNETLHPALAHEAYDARLSMIVSGLLTGSPSEREQVSPLLSTSVGR